jgi:hypothetical protein
MDDINCAHTISSTKTHATLSIKVLAIFTVIALVAVLSLFTNPRPAYADGSTFCQLGNGGPCKEVFAVGSNNQPLQGYSKVSGPSKRARASIGKAAKTRI